MTTEVCFVENSNALVTITAQSSIGIDNFETVLEIPSSRFITGHAYVLVFSGTYGAPGGSGSAIPEIMPYLGTFPFGTFLTNQRSSGGIPPLLQQAHVPYFALYRNLSWPASTKIALVATNRNASGQPNFQAQGSIMVWDLTNLTAESIPFVWGTSAAPQNFPIAPAAPTVVSSATLPSTQDWLQMYYVSCLPSGNSFGANLARHGWEYEGAARDNDRTFYKGLSAATPNRQWSNGKLMAAFTPVATTGTFEVKIQDTASTANGPSLFVNAHVFAVKMDSRLFGAWTQPGATANNIWSRVFPYDSTELLLITTPSYYYSNIAISQINTPNEPGSPAIPQAGSALLTVEGEAVAGPIVPVAPDSVGLGTGQRVGMQRIGNHGHGGGRHYASLRGGIFPVIPSSTPGVPFSGDDAQIILFNGIVGVIVPAPVAEVPGPVTAFTPQRESPVAIASLTALPYEPTWGRPVASEQVVRELRIPTGYVISSPKFSRAVETVELSFTRDSASFATLLAFFQGLTTTRTAFKWQPPWELSAQAYAVLSMTPEEENPSQRGIRTLRVSALKLVWVPP